MGDYQKAYKDFLADPDGFWAKMALELDWITALECGEGVELPVCEVVPQCTT